MLDTGNLLSIPADIVRNLASFNTMVTLLAPIIDGGIAELLKARTTLPTASVNGEIERVVHGGAPLSAVPAGGGA